MRVMSVLHLSGLFAVSTKTNVLILRTEFEHSDFGILLICVNREIPIRDS